MSFRNGSVALAAALSIASLTLAPASAEAQCTMSSPTCSHVTPDAKGMIGLGLIGAEIGFIVPALIQDAMHANEWWPYLVFPALGAVGGVIGGYFLEVETRARPADPDGTPEVAVSMLAIGMALIVPTMVGTLALSAYDPNDVAQQQGSGEEGEDLVEPEEIRDETTTEAVQVEDTSEAPPSGEGGDVAPSSDGSGGDGGGASSPSDGGGASLRRRMDSLLAGGPGILRFDGRGRQVLLGLPMVRSLATFTLEETRSLQLAPSADVHIPVISGTF